MKTNSDFGMAVHTLLIIHEYSKTQKVTSVLIAEVLGTNPVLVRNLIGKLKKAGFIAVAPRKEKAGTTMARSLADITVLAVFEAVEPDYVNLLLAPSIRFSKHSYTGMYVNEMITDYINTAVCSIRASLGSITLADTLAALEKKEADSPYENPRALFTQPPNAFT